MSESRSDITSALAPKEQAPIGATAPERTKNQPTPSQPDKAIYHGTDHSLSPNYHPHHPFPDPKTGALIIDPDIVLIAKQFNLTLSFFYSSRTSNFGSVSPYGVGRSASFAGAVLSDSTGDSPTVTRGDFRAIMPFSLIGIVRRHLNPPQHGGCKRSGYHYP